MARFGGPGRRWGNDGEPVEKPYQLIPLFAAEPRRESPPGHGVLAHCDEEPTLAGVIHFTVTLLTPLHIGMGIVGLAKSKGDDDFAALPVVTRRYRASEGDVQVVKEPVLPGSSLKGALRSMVEAISASCFPVAEKRMRPYMDRGSRCTDPSGLCPACRLFGNTRYAGHVLVSDLRFPRTSLRWQVSPLLWQPGRDAGLKNRYLDHGKPAGRKFFFHRSPAGGPDKRVAVRQGSSVRGRLVFDGVRGRDLGLLLAAMGVDPDHPFPIKVGGGKPVGLGSAQIRVESVVARESTAAGRSVRQTGRVGAPPTASAPGADDPNHMTGEALTVWLRSRIGEAQEAGLLLREAYQRLQSILDPAGLKKPAPDQPY